MQIDPLFGDNPFIIQIQDKRECYVMPSVDSNWIKPGFFHGTALGLLDVQGRIHLFSKDADEAVFFRTPPPPQPPGFPLAPTVCPGQ